MLDSPFQAPYSLTNLSLLKLDNETGLKGVYYFKQLLVRLGIHISAEQLIYSVSIKVEVQTLLISKGWYVVQKSRVLLDYGITVTFFDPSDIHKLVYNPFKPGYGLVCIINHLSGVQITQISY